MKMLINGEWRDANEGKTIDVINPATMKVIDTIPRGTRDDINIAVEAAKEGYRVNHATPALKRGEYLLAAAELIDKNHDDIKKTLIAENAKTHWWADFEINKTAEIIRSLVERSKDPQGKTYPMDSMKDCAGQIAIEYRQPRGVVGGIIPFNFPLEMMAYKLGGALCAGNSVVLKLSEDCPLACLKVGELLLRAGVPASIFHMVTGYGEEAGIALVEHPDVPMITFTGSSAVGKDIMERSGKYLKHLSLELGGNDPVIVCDDADLDTMAKNLIKGRFTVGNGQACVADKRIIVNAAVEKSLIEKCSAVAASLKMGDPADPSVDVGPVIHERAAETIENMLRDAVAKGAVIHFGGKRDHCYIEPTVISGVKKGMLLYGEECFGPVVNIISCRDDREAIKIANDSRYGLQGAVYSRDISRAFQLADEMEVGGVVINGSSCFRPGNVPYMPRKESGIGTDNMYNCYDEMTCGKAIVVCGAVGRFL
jgi:glyceraldehyde-3-phosphate dehydrogenase (NADP+)